MKTKKLDLIEYSARRDIIVVNYTKRTNCLLTTPAHHCQHWSWSGLLHPRIRINMTHKHRTILVSLPLLSKVKSMVWILSSGLNTVNILHSESGSYLLRSVDDTPHKVHHWSEYRVERESGGIRQQSQHVITRISIKYFLNITDWLSNDTIDDY